MAARILLSLSFVRVWPFASFSASACIFFMYSTHPRLILGISSDAISLSLCRFRSTSSRTCSGLKCSASLSISFRSMMLSCIYSTLFSATSLSSCTQPGSSSMISARITFSSRTACCTKKTTMTRSYFSNPGIRLSTSLFEVNMTMYVVQNTPISDTVST